MASRKYRVLIPYQRQWDVADHCHKWHELQEFFEFIKYRMPDDAQVFRKYLSSSQIDALWITEEFFKVLGGPTPFWNEFPESLKAIVVPWVGCDFIDSHKLRMEKDITLCNIGPHAADNVADLAVFLLLSCFRMTSFWERCLRMVEQGDVGRCKEYLGSPRGHLQNLQWKLQDKEKLWSGNFEFPMAIEGSTSQEPLNVAKAYTVAGKAVDSPAGKSVLIIGFGSIGQSIGFKLYTAFKMEIHYFKRSGPVPQELLGYNATYHESLQDCKMWQKADAIILALPGNSSTIDLINDKTLSMCKQGVRLINVGRGTCIDEDALLRALETGQVASCGLDVFKDETTPLKKELLARWDVTLLPHIGSTVADIVERQTAITLQNLEDIFIHGGKGVYPIN